MASPSGRCSECGAPLSPEGLCTLCPSRDTAPIEEGATRPRLDAFPDLPPEIDGYRILRVLGEGGMGLVYLAEQATPFRREVALKVLKIGLNTREVVARFEAERQALALMRHSHIAQIYGAGATEDGRPYFVMEYVSGEPITDYCDRNGLSTRARLELFTLVCGAFEHAHQRGIIHRDVKPQNILVTVQDGHAVPKVIDFGVAKATRQRLTEKTIYTHLGLLIGTPAYMSPEQAELGGVDITTATDIYSLGVLLYELLISVLPFDPAVFRHAGYAEIQRIIREEEPLSPSTRLSALRSNAASIAQQRQTDVATLLSEIKGNLDWIVLKALEKAPDKRYPSASDLAADVSRYLQSGRVLARPSPLRTRLRRLVRRHPVGSRAAAAAGVLMLPLVVVAVWALMTPSGVSLTVPKPVGGTLIGGGLVCGTHGTICSIKKSAGEAVELYPVADPGYVFSSFSGDCGPTGHVPMTEATSCAATFRKAELASARVTRSLTIATPTGGTIVSPNGILCGTLGSLCSATLDEGLVITLRAMPDSGHRFVQFTGACAAGGETTMSEDRVCGGAFSVFADRADRPGPIPPDPAPPRPAFPPLPETLRVSARQGESERDRLTREKTARSQLEDGRKALENRQFDAAIAALQSALTTSGRADYGFQPNEAASLLRMARNGRAAAEATQRSASAQKLVDEARALTTDVAVALAKLREARNLDPEIQGIGELTNRLEEQVRAQGERALTLARNLDARNRNQEAIKEYSRAIFLLDLAGGHKDLQFARSRLAELNLQYK
jgi:serine/threonine protein kinase